MTLQHKNAVTLTELLVGTVLIGIVMVGIAAFSNAIKQIHGSTDKSTILAMRTAFALKQMSSDAFLAVGSNLLSGSGGNGCLPDCGLVYNNTGADQSICFRQDADNDPTSYANDIWICYFKGGANGVVERCVGTPVLNIPPATMAQCSAAPAVVTPYDYQLSQNDFFQIVRDVNSRLEYVEITLTTRTDTANPAHPMDNPEYTLTTRVSPPGLSR